MRLLQTIFVSLLLTNSLFSAAIEEETPEVVQEPIIRVSNLSIGAEYKTRIAKDSSHDFTKISLPFTFEMYDEEYRRRYLKAEIMHLNDSAYKRTQTAISSAMGIETQYITLEAGITPTGATIDPSLTALLSLQTRNDFFNAKFNFIRESLENSMISYVGDMALDSDDVWGRVLKNGAELRLSYDSKLSYNLDLAYYPVIEGENTLENSEVKIVASALYHVEIESLSKLEYGIKATYDTYENNNNLFIYGYGGYFSPKEYTSGDFILNMANIYDSRLFWELESSIGYESYEVDGVQKGTASLADAYSKSAITYALAFSSGFNYKNNLDLILDISFDSMREYQEGKAKFSFVYFFGERDKQTLYNYHHNSTLGLGI